MAGSQAWVNGAHSQALDIAVTPIRMGTYLAAAQQDATLARDFYVWDRDIAAAFLADIAIVEVALRNAMDVQLVKAYGADWYSQDIGLDSPSRSKLAQAWDRLPQARRTHGHLVAGLMFGFWRGLLEPGGYVGKEPQRFHFSHEGLWNSVLSKAFRGGRLVAAADGSQFTRSWTLGVVSIVHAVRNRAAHHEPFVSGFPLPGQQTRLQIQDGHDACLKLTGLLDRDLADWMRNTSSLPGLIGTRPH
ncbi:MULTISPECIES: hypothetical protein [Arthrobacter]|uniref:Abi-like protein n=2 Tax=Arthrobacter TaxID=1663 RepID=A0ABU9KLS1_9MICC|nr:hypothetical protein [Arthrobacter sp. YJM1]MDP5228214.1 hypothetical protein [Arthrobacter sp. YJM1]